MRTTVAMILVPVAVIGAYLLGVYRSTLDPDDGLNVTDPPQVESAPPEPAPEYVVHRDEGPVCFRVDIEGRSIVLVTPRLGPADVIERISTAAIVVNESRLEIDVTSDFRYEHPRVPSTTLEYREYPTVVLRLGAVESGEYTVRHGQQVLGVVALPVVPGTVTHSHEDCLLPSSTASLSSTAP